MFTIHRFLSVLAAFFVLTTVACDTTSSDDEPGERYYEFTHADDDIDYSFTVRTSDPEVIDQVESQLALPLDERNMFILGDIERGMEDYNPEWSWHFIPDGWELTEASVEVCDGRPDMVEEDPDYWVDELGYFCPWSSRVLREVEPGF